LLVQSLAVASGERRWVVFRRHPDIRDQAGDRRCRRLLERGPAAILFVETGALAARVVQEALADVLPDRVRTVKADGIGLLYFDGPAAASAAASFSICFGVGMRQLAG
jgi:hypothetical protein